MKKMLLFIFLSMPTLIFAQNDKTGNLTVFSEDGDRFYLILNGEKQNNVPQTNLRLVELPQPYYNAKIIFTDSTLATISKNNLMIADAENQMMDVTYKIKKDKNGKPKLNYFSAIEVKKDFIPAAGVHVYHYGQPAMVQVSNGTTLSTTTTTTTYSEGVSMNVNGMGVGMNVTITEPQIQTTTTTVTTTSENYSNNNSGTTSRGCSGLAMSITDFNAALKSIEGSNFDDTKLSTAKTVVSKNCLSTDQVLKICKLFSFEDNKLAFAKHAYRYTTDKKNYFKLVDVFTFSANKEALNNFIEEN
ncbi:MAG: DUF4476 domain-containing protein [Ferruginibacter sp.]|nr:DUF4476 domain-containing protein [Ferruginibacter sp.]